jgi:hypothetical protein
MNVDDDSVGLAGNNRKFGYFRNLRCVHGCNEALGNWKTR